MQFTKFCTKKSGVLFTLTTALLISALAPAAHAADDGSLDSLWMDHEDKQSVQSESSTYSTAGAAPPASNSAAQTQAKPTESPALSDDTAAPMCTLETFKQSAIVSKGGWPGVGPFKEDSDYDFLDEHHNKLHVDVSGQQITRAEMALRNRQLSGDVDKDLLDMQMNVDFFLEAVGIRPTKIQELNAELSRNKGALLRADEQPLNFKAGRCSVTIDKKQSADGSKVDFVIAVNSLDANRQVLRQHSNTETRSTTAIATTSDDPKSALSSRIPVKPTASTTLAGGDSLKAQFVELINGWQKIKKVAVRNRQTDELQVVLAGRALLRQTDAIKWLLTNKKYYEMNPKGAVVDQFAELAPAKKYMVSAQVREAYKFIDEPTGKVLKEVDDVNKVNYTVEKIGGKWVITDSALLAPPTKAPVKASTTNKSTR